MKWTKIKRFGIVGKFKQACNVVYAGGVSKSRKREREKEGKVSQEFPRWF